MLLNNKETLQVGKVLEEPADLKTNAARMRIYTSEITPIIDAPHLYSDCCCQAVQEKIFSLIKKNSIPSLLRKTIWPKVTNLLINSLNLTNN